MGMPGGIPPPPPQLNPFEFQQPQSPKNQRPTPEHRMRGKWDEDSVDQELPIIEETKRIVENPDSMIGAKAGGSLKSKLKYGLEAVGWKLNRRSTFKANFPFGSTYLIFESTSKLDAGERYRMKIVMGNSSVLEYKIVKWILVEAQSGRGGIQLVDVITNTKFLVVLLVGFLALMILLFVSAFNVCGQPVEPVV